MAYGEHPEEGEQTMKAPYVTPAIARFRLQDKELLTMAIPCKTEVDDCCWQGTASNCDPDIYPPGGGGPAGLTTPNTQIGS